MLAFKHLVFAGAAAAVMAFGVGEPASAAAITYRVDAIGYGLTDAGGGRAKYEDLPFSILWTGDTSTLFDNPGHSRSVELSDARFITTGVLQPLDVSGGVSFRVAEGPGAGAIDIDRGFGSPLWTFEGSGLAGYDAVSDIAGVPVTWLLLPAITLPDGRVISFENPYDSSVWVHGAEFSAVLAGVPEPGSWLLMMLGFGLAGAAVRRRRAPAHA